MIFRRLHRFALYISVLALIGQLLSPVVHVVTQARLSEPARPVGVTMSRVEVRERLRQFMHMSVTEIRAAVTEHNSGSKRLCQLASSLSSATASALPTGFVATLFLTITVPLPRPYGVPVEGHDIEGLHPLSTGPPA